MVAKPDEYYLQTNLEEVKTEFLVVCGNCDYGVTGACNCPKRDYRSTMDNLVRELEWRRAAMKEAGIDG